MTAVASLGMYDFPSVRAANDALWSHVARHLREAGFGDVPEGLDRERPLDAVWTDPDLLLAQACGYPFVTHLHRRVRLVCTPVYDAFGCDGPLHRAAVVVASDDPALTLAEMRGRRCAVNDLCSNTGFNLLRRLIAGVAGGGRFLAGPVHVTGSHVASLAAVARGAADFASIDCVTLAYLRRDAPETLARVRVLQWTGLTPGLPLVTGVATPPARLPALRHALRLALRTVDGAVRDATLIRSFATAPARGYDEIAETEREAGRLGYPVLH